MAAVSAAAPLIEPACYVAMSHRRLCRLSKPHTFLRQFASCLASYQRMSLWTRGQMMSSLNDADFLLMKSYALMSTHCARLDFSVCSPFCAVSCKTFWLFNDSWWPRWLGRKKSPSRILSSPFFVSCSFLKFRHFSQQRPSASVPGSRCYRFYFFANFHPPTSKAQYIYTPSFWSYDLSYDTRGQWGPIHVSFIDRALMWVSVSGWCICY